MLAAELLQLPGVGVKTARLLWDRFPSAPAMARATLEELLAIPGLGEKRARKLHSSLQLLASRQDSPADAPDAPPEE